MKLEEDGDGVAERRDGQREKWKRRRFQTRREGEKILLNPVLFFIIYLLFLFHRSDDGQGGVSSQSRERSRVWKRGESESDFGLADDRRLIEGDGIALTMDE